MKLNPLFARYLKAALIIPIFFFLILSINVFSSESRLKGTIQEIYKNDLSDDYNDPTAYNEINYEEDGSVVDLYWAFESCVNLNGHHILFLSFAMICILLMFLYYEERDKRTANFMYNLPIKKEKIFFYKWISGVIMFLILFTLLSILIFTVYNKYITILSKYVSEVYGGNVAQYQIDRTIDIDNFWTKSFLPQIIYLFIYCILGYTYMSLFQVLFGKPIIGLVVSILSIVGIIRFVMGLDSFFSFYEIAFSIEEIFYKVLSITLNNYTIVFEIFVLFLIGLLLYKKNDFAKNGSIFMFKQVKLLLYIGVFLCSGPFMFSLLRYINLSYLNNITAGLIALICGSIFSTLILNKIIIINE